MAAGAVADDGELELARVVVEPQLRDRVPVFQFKIELRRDRLGARPGDRGPEQAGRARAPVVSVSWVRLREQVPGRPTSARF